MAFKFTVSYLEDATQVFRQYKNLAEAAMAQVSDDQLYAKPDRESNSIAIMAKHIAGNMLSRWTNFLTTDGEKPNRNRDGEFEEPPPTRAALMEMWARGWDCLFAALASLSEEDLSRVITIRGEPHSVTQAINRAVGHYACHCGQIVFLAKHLRETEWKTLSVPRGKSQEFNRKAQSGEVSPR